MNDRYLKGVVRSKISHGYVEVDILGETLIFIRSKSDKNWPRSGASITTYSKNNFCPILDDLKSQAKHPRTSDVEDQSANRISQVETCRTIGSRRFRRRKLKKYERAMPSVKQQRLCTHAGNY